MSLRAVKSLPWQTGGEIAACVIVDSISRLLDGVISKDSIINESFNDGLLEYPQYTHPQEFDGYLVPDILLSGHHANIKKWQRQEQLRKTYLKRPDLLTKCNLSKEDLDMLEQIKQEQYNQEINKNKKDDKDEK